MSIPVCPVHQRPMRDGKFGFFCATKLPDGNWCKEKVSMVQTPVAAEAVPNPPSLPRIRLAEAALAFAGAVYHGSGPTGTEEALTLAASAYSWLVNGTDDGIPF